MTMMKQRDEATSTMTATTAMVETATAMVTATMMVTVTTMMLPPLLAVMMSMTMGVAFKDGDWTTAIGQQQWDNDGVRQQRQQ